MSDFAWSHDGRIAVICYQDGFVLVGSVNGQRYWSHAYDLATKHITCATWTPNDAFILLGISDGSFMILDENSNLVRRISVKEEDHMTNLAYNSPKFFIDELLNMNKNNHNNNDSSASNNNSSNNSSLRNNSISFFNNSNNTNNYVNNSSNSGSASNNSNANFNEHHHVHNRVDSKLKNRINNNNYILACSFKSSVVYLLKNYEDIDPIIIDTKLEGLKFEWSNSGRILAIGGYSKQQCSSISNDEKVNLIHFYDTNGVLIYKIEVPTVVSFKIILERYYFSIIEITIFGIFS